jgi:hypothetical protein
VVGSEVIAGADGVDRTADDVIWHLRPPCR